MGWKKATLLETESRMILARVQRMEEMLIKGFKLLVRRLISSKDIVHSMVTIVNNTISYS